MRFRAIFCHKNLKRHTRVVQGMPPPPENFEKMDCKLCILDPFFAHKNVKRQHTIGGPGACPPRKILKNWTLISAFRALFSP